MSKEDEITVKTYDRSAEGLANYFKGIGPRVKDIELGFKLADQDPIEARVVEIGCGDGRDAAEIVKIVKWYEGFDPSKGLLKIARHRLPGKSFVLADALTYKYPKNTDVIYAFASLLHVNKVDLGEVFKLVGESLRKGGIIFISLKAREDYEEELRDDEFGSRMFYYYYPDLIKQIAGEAFLSVYEDFQTMGKGHWFTIALKKR